MPSPESKPEWRHWAKDRRHEIDHAAASARLVAVLGKWQPLQRAAVVLTYLPMRREIDLTPLATADPARFCVTRTPPDGPLTVHPFEEPRELHRLGFSQPVDSAVRIDPAEVELALVPGLCFDRRGVRLGRGTAYFDELLRELPGTTKVGITAAALVVNELPEEPHDVRMDFLATEDGVSKV